MFTNDYYEELVDKYALQSQEFENFTLSQKLEQVRDYLKNEIYIQYKLQEGAVKMRNEITDKKRLQELNLVIKQSNKKIESLNLELHDLANFIVVSQSESTALDSMLSTPNNNNNNNTNHAFDYHHHNNNNNNNHHQQQQYPFQSYGNDSPEHISYSNGSSGRPSAEGTNHHQQQQQSSNGFNNNYNNNTLTNNSTTMNNFNSTNSNQLEEQRLSAHEQRIKTLNRQLEIETKIKIGAENLLQTFSKVPKKDKICEEAKDMLKDAKLKIEYIRMQLNKINNQFNEQSSLNGQLRNGEDSLCKLFLLFSVAFLLMIS